MASVKLFVLGMLLWFASSVGVPTYAQTSDELFLDATGLFDEGRFDEALLLYDKVLTTDPTLIRARYYRARCLEEIGVFDDALAEARRYKDMETNQTGQREAQGLVARLEITLGVPEDERRSAEFRGAAKGLRGTGVVCAGLGTALAIIATATTYGLGVEAAPGTRTREQLHGVYGAGIGLVAVGFTTFALSFPLQKIGPANQGMASTENRADRSLSFFIGISGALPR